MRKQLRIILPLAIVSFLIGAGLWAFYAQSRNIVEFKEPNLSQEERQASEAELQNLLSEFDELEANNNATDEQRYNLYVKLGASYRRLGRLEEARKVLLKAIKIRDTEPTAWAELFAVYVDMNDIKKALPIGEKVVNLRPTDAHSWSLYLELNRNVLNSPPEEMEELYQRAFFGTGFHGEIAKSYASFKESRGDFVAALNYIKIALEADPDNQSLKNEAARLEVKVFGDSGNTSS